MKSKCLAAAVLVLIWSFDRSVAVNAQTVLLPDLSRTSSIQLYHIRGPIYVLSGGGGNVVASVGPDGVALVDSGSAESAEKVLATIRQLQTMLATSGVAPIGFGAESIASLERMRATPAPPEAIRFIFNTSMDADHTGGNAVIGATGRSTTGGNVAAAVKNSGEGAAIYAHENVLIRMSKPAEKGPDVPSGALPTLTYRADYYKVQPFMNGEGIQLLYRPAAHTDGDSMVWFRGSDILATGDLFSQVAYPSIDVTRGGSIQGTIDALNGILDIAFPEFRHEGGTFIVPGHGRISDFADVAYYRDMVTIVRDRIKDMIKKGSSLEQIKAAHPTADYDPRYDASGKAGDTFTETVYRSLTANKQGTK